LRRDLVLLSTNCVQPETVNKNLILSSGYCKQFPDLTGEKGLLERSAIILAGGFSTRLGQDKGLVQLVDKPLIRHVLDKTKNVVDETLVVVSSNSQAQKYRDVLGSEAKISVDNAEAHSPLAGATVGFQCDVPFLSKDILQLLLELAIDKNAAIPRWPNCNIEPLQAVYLTEAALRTSKEAVMSGEAKMQAMVNRLRGVRYVSTLVLEQLDPGLNTFFNVNTVVDLKKAEAILKHK
jgi:molybdopterin-guanine dinucleotide biosynthesis protein A